MNPPVPGQLRIRRAVHTVPAVGAVLASLIALLALIGWITRNTFLKTFGHPLQIALNPLSAICIIIVAMALVLLRYFPWSWVTLLLARLMSATVALIALARMADYSAGTHFYFDRMLFKATLADKFMSPNSAFCLLLFSMGLLLLDWRTRVRTHPAQILILVGGSVGLLSLIGYLYRTAELYAVHGFTPMSLNASVSFVTLSAAILCSRPQRQPLISLLSDTYGGLIARRLIPAAFLVPLAAGRLQLLGSRMGWYDPMFGLAILVLANIVAFNVLIWWCASAMRASDLRRRMAEEVLRDSEARHRAILEQAAEGIYLVDLNTKRVVDSNPAMERLLGYERGEANRRTVYDFVADTPEKIDQRLQQLAASNSPLHGQRQYRRKDGSLIDIEATASVIVYGGRRVACTVAHDVTARVRAEAQLRASEARFRLIIETAHDAFIAMDSQGLIIDWNPQAEAVFGWKRDEVMGKQVDQIVMPERFRAQHTQGLQHFLLTQQGPVLGRRLELIGLHKDSHEFPVELTVSPARMGDSVIFFSFIHDITARKRAEEERDRFFTLSSDMVAVAGFDGIFKRVNQAFVETLGYSMEELLSRPWLEFVHPDDRDDAVFENERLKTGQRGSRFTNRYLCKDGAIKWLSWTSVAVVNDGLIYAIARDMTDAIDAQEELETAMRSQQLANHQLKEAQSQLVQSEKLAGLGQMVAGVAHEINNPLSFVSNNVAVLQRDIRALSELLSLYATSDTLLATHQPELLQQIKQLSERMDLAYTQKNIGELLTRSREGLRRIQQIVGDLRDFARLDQSDLQEVDLNAGIESTLNIIAGKARKKRVAIQKHLQPLPLISCFPAKINQVVMNLVANAVDAAPEGGWVRVETKSTMENVEIAISDNGAGVPPEISGRIFDPFFTTKPIGEGTGLGLSISYGIVKDHGGTILLQRAKKGGALFIVRIPLHPAKPPGKSVLAK